MNTTQSSIARLCRLDGQSPTARERWTAFHRLWRMALRRDEMGRTSTDCFRVLWDDWGWIRLLDEPRCDELELMRVLPKAVRLVWVKRRRAERLAEVAEKELRKMRRLLNAIFNGVPNNGDE